MSTHFTSILHNCLLIADECQRRIYLFNYVRDIPYATGGKQDPIYGLEQQLADCRAKALLLKVLLQALGYEARMLLAKYKLRPFPAEVQFIPEGVDYHHALEVSVNGRWICLDPTYDPPLAKHGFKVNYWDGINSTPLAEDPIVIKREDEKNLSFDQEFAAFQEALCKAYERHPTELQAYTSKFNEWLTRLRRTPQ